MAGDIRYEVQRGFWLPEDLGNSSFQSESWEVPENSRLPYFSKEQLREKVRNKLQVEELKDNQCLERGTSKTISRVKD